MKYSACRFSSGWRAVSTGVGVKMGLTSRAKMEQVGVDRVIWGRLTDAMGRRRQPHFSNYVHPRAEPEVAFLLKQPPAGKVTITEAAAAQNRQPRPSKSSTRAMRISNSSLSDVVADNSSSSGFVVGRWNRPDLDIDNLGIVLEVNGRPAQVGSVPPSWVRRGERWRRAAELSALSDEPLQAGWIVRSRRCHRRCCGYTPARGCEPPSRS